MVTERYSMWGQTPFEQWVRDEDLKVHTHQFVEDVRTAELAPWPRVGCDALLLDLTADPLDGALVTNQGTVRYLIDIPAGGSLPAERHLYEEIFYVVEGRGATTIWYDDGPKHTFEWQEDSVFSIPLNAHHEIFNAQGDHKVRLYSATNAPTAFNFYASPEFIFNCPASFTDRFDPHDELYFSGKANKLEDRYMETNFIPNVRNIMLDRWTARGPGANMMITMAGGHFICHLSEFPAGTYKKGHTSEFTRNRAGLVSDTAYLFLSGEGYDLQWGQGSRPQAGASWERINYKTGTLVTNGTGYHQHFNPSTEPIRYIVLRYGNPRYAGALGKATKETGGVQIEFEEEDPAVRALFEDEVTKRGGTSGMPPVKA